MRLCLRKIGFYKIFWILLYFFIFCLLWRGAFSYLDPDLGWHLQVGKEIMQSKQVPQANLYNYSFTGSWVDHEWLSNVLAYLSYNNWGYLATTAVFALVIIIVLILLNIWVRRIYPKASPGFIAFFQVFGVIASLPHFGVRMQETGVLFLLLLFMIIYEYSKERRWPILLWLIPVMYVWSCLHASFLIGLFLMAAWTAIKLLEKILFRLWSKDWFDFSGMLSCKEIFVFIAAALLAAGATLLTPYKAALYYFLSGYKDTFYQSRIQEWLSQFSFPFHYSQLVYLSFVVLGIALYVYYSISKEKRFKIDLWRLFLAILFVFLSFQARRHFPLMFVATFVLLIEVYSVIFSLPNNGNKKWRLNFWLKAYLLFCLLLGSVYQLLQTRFITDPFGSFCADYPCGAVDFLKSHPNYDNLRLFNDYGWGGYLIWTLPQRKLFIDGRLPQVSFAGHSYLQEYLEFFKSEDSAARKLNQYDIKLVLIPVKDQKIKVAAWEKIIFGIKEEELSQSNELRNYLASSSDWTPVYYDATAIIFLKK